MPSKFHLKRYFALVSLAAIMAVGVSIAKVAFDLAQANLLKQQIQESENFAHAFASTASSPLASFLAVARGATANQPATSVHMQQLDAEVSRIICIQPMLKLRILSIDGITIYSSSPGEIGSDNRNNSGFQTALRGEIFSELRFFDNFDIRPDVKLSQRHVLVSYIPLRSQPNGAVDAVLGLYKEATPAVEQLERSRMEIGIMLMTGGGALYLVLLLATVRASKILRKAEEHIHFHAFHDPLTGLPNRTTFHERVTQAIKRSNRSKKPFGVMFLDLDRFKNINDSLGHDTGDEILKAASRRIQIAVRETDLVFRLGGDEFTVLLENLDAPESAATVARRINTSMSVSTKVGDQEASLMASIGIATFPADGETADDLIKAADTAMYSAKELGGNQFHFFTKDMNRAAQARWELETALHRAVHEHQFLLHYQPKINCDSREVAGIEALLRWQHPTRGILSPTDFLPFLEQSGLIVPVGEWVLREACKQNKFWQESSVPPVRISVNVSARQFRADSFVDIVTRALAEVELDPRFLELELTESVLLDNPRNAIRKMEELKAVGVTLAIDDFGAGYSSLSYLKHFPVDYLKVDKSFIADLQKNHKDNAITLAIAGLAKSLNLGIVAEGVETAEQVKLLRTHGYNELQGFLFAKPMAPSAIPAFMMANHSEALTQAPRETSTEEV